jgi:hypothetical protein
MPSTPTRSAGPTLPRFVYPDAGKRDARRLPAYLVAVLAAAAAAGFTSFASPVAPAGATPMLPFSTGTPISLGPGISLTPANGWTAQQTPDGNYVELDNAAGTAKLEVTVGSGQSADPVKELNGNVQQFMQNYGYTNVNLAAPVSNPVNSRFFQQSVTQAFTANDSTPPGAAHQGMFTELMNTTTTMAAFAAFQASPDVYDAASVDANNMINSML